MFMRIIGPEKRSCAYASSVSTTGPSHDEHRRRSCWRPSSAGREPSSGAAEDMAPADEGDGTSCAGAKLASVERGVVGSGGARELACR